MNNRLDMPFLKQKPLFIFLLPLFFVLHGYIRNIDSIRPVNALLLTLLYIGIACALAAISYLFFRDIMKACLFSTALMGFNFFFGFIQDSIRNIFPGSFLGQYRFLIPVAFLLLLLLIFSLKSTKRSLKPVSFYLNLLFIIFIFFDIGMLITKVSSEKKQDLFLYKQEPFKPCDTCSKPDIYLLLFDQYAGSEALKNAFGFDNSSFEKALTDRGYFVVPGASSNYNLTPFSMGSILNMNYLGKQMGEKKNLDINYSYRAVRNNRVMTILDSMGYEFHNYSVFDFPGQPARKYKSFLPYGTELINSQTFVSRLIKDVKADILSGKIDLPNIQKKIAYRYLHFNDEIFSLTEKSANKKNTRPRFIYTHFMMPHWPYYYDSKGQQVPVSKLRSVHNTTANDYVEYLQYCNSRILELSDRIMSSSTAPPIIILLGDHGFRHPEKKADRKYDFVTLNAVYMPNQNYSQFYSGMTNVNAFRAIFNAGFYQQFSFLKDSCIDLWD